MSPVVVTVESRESTRRECLIAKKDMRFDLETLSIWASTQGGTSGGTWNLVERGPSRICVEVIPFSQKLDPFRLRGNAGIAVTLKVMQIGTKPDLNTPQPRVPD
jgi:hypothetical protein